MRYFLSILFVYAHLSPNFHRFVILCIYVWIHQVRILVFYTDNYQMCPVPLKHRQTLSLSLSLSLIDDALLSSSHGISVKFLFNKTKFPGFDLLGLSCSN